MKFSSLAIFAAVLCATAVVGAPSTPNLWFEELISSNPFDIEDPILDYWLKFKCVREVLDKETNIQVKALWTQYKGKLEKLYEEEWTKCDEISDIEEQKECKFHVSDKGLMIYSEFYSRLLLLSFEKAKEITDKIAKKCYSKHGAIDESEDIEVFADESLAESLEFDNLSQNPIEKLKCISNAITDGLKNTDFEKPWANLKKDLEQLVARLKACKNKSSLLEVAKCIAKETESAKSVIEGFLKNMEKVNKEAYELIKKYIKERCQ